MSESERAKQPSFTMREKKQVEWPVGHSVPSVGMRVTYTVDGVSRPWTVLAVRMEFGEAGSAPRTIVELMDATPGKFAIG